MDSAISDYAKAYLALAARVAEDAEDLAVGPGGALALHSSWRWRVRPGNAKTHRSRKTSQRW